MAKSANVMAWGTFAVISYVWLFTSKLDSRPSWEPMVALVVNALPGGMVAELAKTVGLALVDKIPGRSAGK